MNHLNTELVRYLSPHCIQSDLLTLELTYLQGVIMMGPCLTFRSYHMGAYRYHLNMEHLNTGQ